SAARLSSVIYADGSTSQPLFQASVIDPWGRVRDATFGAASYSATYGDTGRRLMRNLPISGANGQVREFSFAAPGASGSFDPIGRERSRTERRNAQTTTVLYSYDPLGRLEEAQTQGPTSASSQLFAYDPLGNLQDIFNPDSATSSTTMAFSSGD